MLLRRHKQLPTVEVAPASTVDFDGMTVKQLKEYAAENNINLGGAILKADILAILVPLGEKDA